MPWLGTPQSPVSLCAVILRPGGGPWPAGSTNLPRSSRRGSGSSRPPKMPPCLQRRGRWRLTERYPLIEYFLVNKVMKEGRAKSFTVRHRDRPLEIEK